MSLTYGPNLGLLVNAATGEAHDVALRALLRGLDGLIQCVVKQVGLNTPPASPADGDCYIVGTVPTGVWASQGNKFTRYSTVAAAWEFFTVRQGWRVYDQATSTRYEYTGSAWSSAITTGNITMDGVLTINRVGSNPTLILNAPASGNTAYFRMYTNGLTRWYFGKDGAAESGSDAGSTFVLQAYTDAGVVIDNPLSVARAAGGAVTIARPTSITGNVTIGTNSGTSGTVALNAAAGNNHGFQYLTAGNLRWFFFQNNAAESGSDAGSNFAINAYSDAGASIDTPLSIVRASGGAMTFGGSTARPATFTGVMSFTAGGTHTFGNNSATGTVLSLAAAAGQVSRLQFTSAAGGRRWQFERSNTAEGGSDAGSNLNVNAYSDLDVYIDTPISIARVAGGAITLSRPVKTASAQESTGAGSAAFGANCPATTVTAPYKWIKFIVSDGSTVYIPAFK